jgi:hypothetical protein
MSTAEITLYCLGLAMCYFGGVAWGTAARVIKDLGSST